MAENRKIKEEPAQEIKILKECIVKLEAVDVQQQIAAGKVENSEIRYRRLFEAAKDGILILDFYTGMILDVNPFLVDLLGCTKSELLKKFVWDVGFLKDIVKSKDAFLKLQIKEYVRYEDLPLETSNGKAIYVEFVSNVYLVNNEKTIQCNIRNITERKEREGKEKKVLHELEVFYRASMGREERIVELKKEIEELKRKCERTREDE
ncbi:MAG: PAS domain S-box protein [Candidatus Omnitrophota bacterium]